MRYPISTLRTGALTLALTLLATLPLAGMQAGSPGSGVPSLRPYVHVFIAYAIAIVLILGWIVSLSKRLGRLERELGD